MKLEKSTFFRVLSAPEHAALEKGDLVTLKDALHFIVAVAHGAHPTDGEPGVQVSFDREGVEEIWIYSTTRNNLDDIRFVKTKLGNGRKKMPPQYALTPYGERLLRFLLNSDPANLRERIVEVCEGRLAVA